VIPFALPGDVVLRARVHDSALTATTPQELLRTGAPTSISKQFLLRRTIGTSRFSEHLSAYWTSLPIHEKHFSNLTRQSVFPAEDFAIDDINVGRLICCLVMILTNSPSPRIQQDRKYAGSGAFSDESVDWITT
jgi:hypothetical protein